MDLAEATIENMKEFEGTVFNVIVPDAQAITIKLDEVAPIDVPQRRRTGPVREPKRVPFALYFLGPPDDPILPQGMYELRSEKLTFESLFMVPVGHGELGTEYEAIFA